MMADTMQTYGADSFVGRLACTLQGSTDTTFYIIALYFGSVGVKKTRHAVPCGLMADLAAILAAIFIAYLFFHSTVPLLLQPTILTSERGTRFGIRKPPNHVPPPHLPDDPYLSPICSSIEAGEESRGIRRGAQTQLVYLT